MLRWAVSTNDAGSVDEPITLVMTGASLRLAARTLLNKLKDNTTLIKRKKERRRIERRKKERKKERKKKNRKKKNRGKGGEHTGGRTHWGKNTQGEEHTGGRTHTKNATKSFSPIYIFWDEKMDTVGNKSR